MPAGYILVKEPEVWEVEIKSLKYSIILQETKIRE